MKTNRFVPPKLSTKSICAIAMLLAITAVLAIFFTFRIGTFIKIPMKFISVFITGVFFGPWIGGFVGAAGDILNVLLMPSGPWIPLLTLGEFICGFIYGVFFYKADNDSSGYISKCIACTGIMFLIDMFYTTYVLASIGYFPGFTIAFEARLVAGILKAIIQFAVLAVFRKLLPRFRHEINKLGIK